MIRLLTSILILFLLTNGSYADSWQPYGSAVALSLSTISNSSVLGWVTAGTAVPSIAYVCDSGSNDAYVAFGGSGLVVDFNNPPLLGAITGTLIPAGGCKTFTLNSTSQYIAGVTKTGTTSIYAITGVGTMPSVTGTIGEVTMPKIVSPGISPGTGNVKMEWVEGTTPGTCKLISYAGTSDVPVTIVDDVGSGC